MWEYTRCVLDRIGVRVNTCQLLESAFFNALKIKFLVCGLGEKLLVGEKLFLLLNIH